VKFQAKILQSLQGQKNIKFVMSFMGSSVTAGHDTAFNISFSELTGKYLQTPLSKFNIQTISRNVALGNNPCVPYDLCVQTFAGNDVDIIHWEQTFNCGGGDHNRRNVYEPFVRMASLIETHPIVVFSDSVTPNWGDDQCKGPLKSISHNDEDKKLLTLLQSSNAREIPHTININSIHEHWNAFTEIINQYRGVGIQVWNHHHYEKYKCHSPYIPNWGCCSASWHPSILGHELRAAHYSYFWLLIFKDAIQFLILQIEKNEQSVDHLMDLMNKHIKSENKFLPIKPLYPSPYTEYLQCYTTFQPRTEEIFSLENIQIPDNVEQKIRFEFKIFEDLIDTSIVKRAKERGYRDFKYILYGNQDHGSLSLKINVKTSNKAFVCQPPGNWGKLPDGFKNLWECGTEFYVTKREGEGEFIFSKEKATRVQYVQRYPEDSQSWLCVEIEEPLPLGEQIFTIVPTTKENIAIAYVLIP
jgi:hypothetical protein